MPETLEKVTLSEEKDTQETAGNTTKEDKNPGLITFKKPYNFEGNSYTEVDVSPIENLTAEDLIEAEDILAKSGINAFVPEINFSYLIIVAAKATGKPEEFFRRLPAKDGIKLKRAVMGFLNAEE
ncbi:phage tail assembly protein [Niallia taxi]|uniref:phage tail assembly protein n=1 Tax=Niallia taxi TaxID=2499688 RepID=UPI002E209D9D|nr:phage tail assembly protein [Niallia taxi]